MPAHHPGPVSFEQPRELDQRLKLAGLDLLDPAAQVLLRGVGIVDLVEVVEAQRELVGSDGLQRLLQQLIEQVLLAFGEVLRALEPDVSSVLQQLLVGLCLRAADLVDRFAEVLLDVEAVKGDLRLRHILLAAGEVGVGHVLADLLDAPHLALVGLKEAAELKHRALIALLGDVDGTTLVQVGEDRHVVLPAPAACLIDPHAHKAREILFLHRLIDVVMEHAPELRVVLADHLGDGLDRHLFDERHHQRLEEQREVRALPRPRHLDLQRAVLCADHPRHPRSQIRLMLEEVQMPSGVRFGVVDLAARRAASRTCKPSPLPEVEPQIQPAAADVELDLLHLPWLLKPKRSLKQVEINVALGHDRLL